MDELHLGSKSEFLVLRDYYDDFIHSQSRKRKLERRHEAQHRDPYDPRVKHQSINQSINYYYY